MNCRLLIVQNSIKTLYNFRKGYIEELSSNSNLEIVAVAPLDCDKAKCELERMGVNVYGPPKKNGFLGLILASLVMNYYILRNIKGTRKIICHFLMTYLMCYPSLFLARGNHILFVEGLGSFFTSNFRLNMLRRILRLSNPEMLYCNEHERKVIGLDGTVTGGIGVDLEYFSYSSPHHSQSFELLYVGRLIKDKGVHDAIEVLRLLKSEGFNVKLTLVGDIYTDNPSSLTENDISKLKCEFEDCLVFSGFSTNVRYSYQNCHALILPSKLEGFPVCVMEASAIGRPSFVYSVPGCSDAVQHGVNGFLCDFGDFYKLASNLKEYIYECNRGADLSISSRNYAEQNFSHKNKNSFICSRLLE